MDNSDTIHTLFVEVLLPLNLKNLFTYRVPSELNEEIIIGKRVSVPFGKKKILAGLIYSIHEKPPKDYEARYIIDVILSSDRAPAAASGNVSVAAATAPTSPCFQCLNIVGILLLLDSGSDR